MADLRLPKLPDRTPVKVSFQATPQLFADLMRVVERAFEDGVATGKRLS